METRHPKIPEAWRSILRLEELDGDGVGFVQQFGRVFCCFDVFLMFLQVLFQFALILMYVQA